MELTLNLVWLLISVASFAYAARRAFKLAPGIRRRQFVFQGSLALAFALVLLFPVISITDDLHSESFVAEEWNATRRSWTAFSAAHVLLYYGTQSVPAAVLVTPLFSVRCLVFLCQIEPSTPFLSTLVSVDTSGPRSPPFAL